MSELLTQENLNEPEGFWTILQSAALVESTSVDVIVSRVEVANKLLFANKTPQLLCLANNYKGKNSEGATVIVKLQKAIAALPLEEQAKFDPLTISNMMNNNKEVASMANWFADLKHNSPIAIHLIQTMDEQNIPSAEALTPNACLLSRYRELIANWLRLTTRKQDAANLVAQLKDKKICEDLVKIFDSRVFE